MRKIYSVLIVLFVWTSFASSQDYFPLREGNQWSYVMSNGVKISVQVTGYAEIDDVHCAIVESLIDNGNGTQTTWEYMTVDTEGLKVYLSRTQDEEVVYNPPLKRIKLPFKQNQIWTSTINQGGVNLVTTYEAVGTRQISTNIGTFQCIEIQSRANIPGQTSMMSVNYYADGIGLVRQEMQIGSQTITSTLVSANVKPTDMIAAPRNGTEPNVPSTQNVEKEIVVDPNEEATFDLYQSSLRKLMFYKPRNWNVSEFQYDNGVNVTSIVRPDESALVVFISFPEVADVNDTVSMSDTCINLFKKNIPDLEGKNIKTSSDKDLTTMNITFSEGDAKGVGNAYFFHTDRTGTGFLLLSRDDIWQKIRPTLVNIVSNIAYSTQDIEVVINKGKTLSDKMLSTEQEKIPNPVAVIQKARKIENKEKELIPSGLTDKSVTLEIPDGWNLEGSDEQFTLTDDDILNKCGMISKSQIVVPTSVTTPGTINTIYEIPSQVLGLILNYENIGTKMEIIGEIPYGQINSEIASSVKNMEAQRYLVDGRLLYVKFENSVTEKTTLGIFSVQCITMSMSSGWQFSIDGCWAQEDEFDEKLPLFLQINKTVKVNQKSDQNEKDKQYLLSQQFNRNLINSIADSKQVFDEYSDMSVNDILNMDYTSWMWSQTTLGQGIWVARSEGAIVNQTNSWGIKEPVDGDVDFFYNKVNFSEIKP